MIRTALAVLISAGFVALTIWVLWRWMRKSEDEPVKLVFKWVTSAILCLGLIRYAVKAGDPISQITAILAAAVCGLILAILWAPNFTSWVAKPFMSLYDGGDLEVIPQPVYGRSHALRKRGDYAGACEAVQQQLASFPADLEGHLLLAEIQAENLSDVPAASATIWQWISSQEQLQPGAVALALNRLADWQLNLLRQPDTARATLENLVRLFPDSEQAQMAIQRVGHLPTTEAMDSRDDREPIHVPKIERIGLVRGPRPPAEANQDLDADALASEEQSWLRQLEAFPADHEAREQLAHLYLDRLGRPDLALAQVRQLIDQPSQPSKQVVRWLNLAADAHVRSGDEAAAREVLQQVIDRGPESAAAEQARQRLARLGVEMRAQKKSQAVKLGSYETKLGLKLKA